MSMIDALPDWSVVRARRRPPRPALRACREAGEVAAALATIVALDGGGPRPVGAQMVIADEAD